ncbi:MAG: cupin domain-containing protein [Planctomycetota bacterium]
MESPPDSIHHQIKHWPALRQFASDKMRKIGLFDTSLFFMDLYCLKPGQEQKPHEHAVHDKVYVVLEGEVEATLSGQTSILKAGDCILAEHPRPHGVKNVSSAEATLLVFMTPNPNRS